MFGERDSPCGVRARSSAGKGWEAHKAERAEPEGPRKGPEGWVRLDSLCDNSAFRESREGADLPGCVDPESLVAKVDLPQALQQKGRDLLGSEYRGESLEFLDSF